MSSTTATAPAPAPAAAAAAASSRRRDRLAGRPVPPAGRVGPHGPGRHRRDVDAVTVDGWCAEYASSRDPARRDRIIAAHQWLVWLCARKMQRRHEPIDDLVQIANIGLLKSLDRFDP